MARWFDGIRESLAWRRRDNLALAEAYNAPDGYISMADLVPSLRNPSPDGPPALGFPRFVSRASEPAPAERGVSGTENLYGYIYNEEYNPKLAGKRAMTVYDIMRRSDPQVHASLDMIKLPIRSSDPTIEAASDDPEDQRIADAAFSALLDDDAMADPFDTVLRHVLLAEDFGTMAVEKIFKVNDDGSVGFHRLAPRLPKTFERFDVDPTGQLTQLVQYGQKNQSWGYFAIPAEYLALFVREQEGDNYWGMSVLRTAYKPWYYKDQIEHIDMIAHDKYGVGTPWAQLQEGFPVQRPGELARLENALLGIRSGQRNFLITNDKVKIEILGAGGNVTRSVKESLDYHNAMIARNVLANHLALGDAPHGTYNLGIAFMDLFLYALQARAAAISGVFKRQIIKPWADLNFDMTGRDYPSLKFANLTNFDIAKMGAAMQQLATSKLLTPTDDIEDMLRQLFQLPPLPTGWRRGDEPSPRVEDVSAAVAAEFERRAAGTPAPGTPTPSGNPATGRPGSSTTGAPDAIAASDRELHVHINMPTPDKNGEISLADVAGLTRQSARDAADMVRAALIEAQRDSLATPQPIHLAIHLPNGKVIRTTSQDVIRDDRGLIIKTSKTETETPDGD